FGHLELHNGFTALISSDVEAQVSVAVICTAPPTESSDNGEFCTEVAPLQLGRLKSLIILQEFVQCYRGDIERLSAESIEQAKLKAEEYTLTSALGGFQDGCDGTLDEFIDFQRGFVDLVMETTARGITNSIMSWSHDGASIMAQSSLAIRLARGFFMNAETGDAVYSTCPGPDGSFFGQDLASQKLHHLHNSARVQQVVKHVAKALHESAPILSQLTHGSCGTLSTGAAVVVRFRHLSGRDTSELFIALRMVRVSRNLMWFSGLYLVLILPLPAFAFDLRLGNSRLVSSSMVTTHSFADEKAIYILQENSDKLWQPTQVVNAC
ncbi:hypothetical protein F441_04771, partial [Phytophthora nicotianae CJ01A1]